jgi:hypothetical protein
MRFTLKKVSFPSFIIVVLSFCAMAAHSAEVDVVSVPGSQGPVISQAEVVELVLKSAGAAVTFPVITLEPVASAMVQALEAREAIPKQIGFSRNVAMLSTVENTSQQLSWHTLPGNGQYAGIIITSPQARALRVGMTVNTLPAGAELRFFSVREGAAVNIQHVSAQHVLDILRTNQEADPQDPDGKVFWSPTVEGDTLGVEMYLPENLDPSSVQVAFPLVSHISIVPFGPSGSLNSAQSYGDANPCQNDVNCASDIWDKLQKSVAGMQFSTGAGTYICTGSLLNDRDDTTWEPYFITANHCISTQAVASTLETHWFWESAACNSTTQSSSYTKISGGARLLHTQGMSSGEPTADSMDTTLMKLNSAPPSGAWFAGWTTSVPPGAGTARTGIHHPKGDWKKISYGTSGGDAECGWFDGSSFGCRSGSGNFYSVNWTNGGTEGGSSGSALYAERNYLIGMLSGGNGSCAGSSSFYSSFRSAYSAGKYSQWLNTANPADPPGPSKPVISPVYLLLLQ